MFFSEALFLAWASQNCLLLSSPTATHPHTCYSHSTVSLCCCQLWTHTLSPFPSYKSSPPAVIRTHPFIVVPCSQDKVSTALWHKGLHISGSKVDWVLNCLRLLALSCLDTRAPGKKKLKVSSATRHCAQHYIHMIQYNPLHPTPKVGFIISRRTAMRLKRWNNLPASHVVLDIFHLPLQIYSPICSLCQSMTISMVPLPS